ncbi:MULTISPECIES: hypothetical protein [Caproicibacterium]|uniref:Uncharacterized protein n=1 Tax=Caproicibacterium argilliputei TaxID=3030016 RepID=A0AA97H050_9FIRM|nr:hypothetical protein [Caproicibacterium argilliputei]WOC31108.1 hypothetical protein PXC00_07655 [Caproicibacterium argilliputei]
MKRILSVLLMLTLLLTLFAPLSAYADDGDGNIDHGGGGLGNGSDANFWNSGDEGVRVTVIRASDHAVASASVDFTNRHPDDIVINFGKVSKIAYNNGHALALNTGQYSYVNPAQPLPKIISSDQGQSSIEVIKEYFCSEYMVMRIAQLTGFSYATLTNGSYKILLEPIAYFTLYGARVAMTATEAALYDQKLGGDLRSKMASLTHKNLPLAMFLDTPDLGYPAWTGSRDDRVSDSTIISSLGLGIVRFSAAEPPPNVNTQNYTYRVNTEVITPVTVSGGQSDPDHPVTVKFSIGGRNYTVGNVYYPGGDSQLAWVRWTTPSTPQTMTIRVSVTGGGSTSEGTINASIVDLSGHDPPDPNADDRNSSYSPASMPSNPQKTSASWNVWRPVWHADWVWVPDWIWHGDDTSGSWEDDGSWVDHGWWDFASDTYTANLSASMSVTPDGKDPTASGETIKSGYGINQTTAASVSTNQSSAVTGAQTAVTYFPEFGYKTYWRLLDQTAGGYNARFEFAPNRYSTYNRRTHFTPLWMPDGSYTPYTFLEDCWTPTGMLSMNLTDSVTIRGTLWSDWRAIPALP